LDSWRRDFTFRVGNRWLPPFCPVQLTNPSAEL
jgi:hypothetical protein